MSPHIDLYTQPSVQKPFLLPFSKYEKKKKKANFKKKKKKKQFFKKIKKKKIFL